MTEQCRNLCSLQRVHRYAQHINNYSCTYQVEALRDPAADFELPAAALPAVPKWGRACDWSARDDSMLLLGVYRYGIDHWDKCGAPCSPA